ncbi:hypothetical protein ACHQM5_025812 [Ranunculus cassubicifolius]
MLFAIEDHPHSVQMIPEVLQGVLQEFQDVFSKPKGLPSVRKDDHEIPLKPECNPLSVKPYRYPHIHKNEIEKQIEEMLQSGIIQPSKSSFTSPVILVKKKDGA